MPTYAEIMALAKTDAQRATVRREFERARERMLLFKPYSQAETDKSVAAMSRRMSEAISKSTMPNLPVGRVTCRHCGQWGERETQCQHCGAPMPSDEAWERRPLVWWTK